MVATTRQTVLFTIASVMTYASFFPWLGSSPALIGDIYGRDSQFALVFGANAVLMALTILCVERLIRRYSTMPVLLAQSALLVVAAAIYVVWSLAADGVPPFWSWFVMVSILTALNASSSPLLQSVAMQPMGALAGTAASVIGASVFLGGAILGSIVDAFIDTTVTPFGVGFLACGVVVVIALMLANRDLSEFEL